MAGIFISYRRAETDIAAGRIAEDLSEIFGSDSVFRDVDGLYPGLNWKDALERALDSCAVLIAVIGRRWITITDNAGNRRIDDPEDWVRTEITRGLARGVRLIPILISAKAIPKKKDLPEELKPLADHQAFQIDDKHWRQDIELLAKAIEKIPGIVRRVPKMYRALLDDFELLQRAMHSLATATRDRTDVLNRFHMVEVTAEPLCKARASISELDDASTRKDLDAICLGVEVMKQFAQQTINGEGAIALAGVYETLLKEMHEKLLLRT